jgi:hypothetical protein
LDTLAKEALSEIVTYEEIIAALNQMHPYKALVMTLKVFFFYETLIWIKTKKYKCLLLSSYNKLN